MTPGELNAMRGNPFYAIDFDQTLVEPHPLLVTEEDWIEVNVDLIEELGPEAYLRNLLSILKGNYAT